MHADATLAPLPPPISPHSEQALERLHALRMEQLLAAARKLQARELAVTERERSV